LIYIDADNSALMAVSMSFNIGIMNMLPWFFRLIIEIVVLLPSVRRVESICSLRTEEDLPKCPDLQISQGKVEFKRVTLVYKGFEEMALSDVTFKVKPRMKFGIVGRSGSGKSSILNALFRFTRLYNGNIFIDDQDINKCTIRSLRLQISFMSQNPYIFTGSIKQNIDPENKFSDEKIISMLSTAGLEDFVYHHGLHSSINESDLSAGQRQLLALCRVLMRNCKIFLMDEATSNMDSVTERKIEELIRRHSRDKTVICIAHKLKLLVNYDLVMLIENGYVSEILPPNLLLTRDPTLAKGFN
jgi:ATP-binding cassette subfamily C (CFTR/MRP) protein 4